MAWDEWEQLKGAAAERHSTRMQLNQYPADQGGDGTQGDLVAGHQDLEAVGKAAHDLFEDFTTYSGHARVASAAAAGGLKGEGFALGAALDHVTERWSEQTKTLLDACAHISNHLRFTKNQHAANGVEALARLDRDSGSSYVYVPCVPRGVWASDASESYAVIAEAGVIGEGRVSGAALRQAVTDFAYQLLKHTYELAECQGTRNLPEDLPRYEDK